MSKSDEIAAKAKRLAATAEPAQAAVTALPTTRQVPVGKVRVKPVRTTVDLPPTTHSALVLWCATAAVEVGRPRVHGQEVIRALVDRLLTDRDLGQSIVAGLK